MTDQPKLLRTVTTAPNALRDELTCRNQGEVASHQEVRRTFLDRVLASAEVRALFESWGVHLALSEPTAAFSAAMDLLAAAAGYPNASYLVDAFVTEDTLMAIRAPADDPAVIAEVRARWGEVNSAALAFDRAMARIPGPLADWMHGDAQRWVCNHDLPWPWLSAELVRRFTHETVAKPWGVRLQDRDVPGEVPAKVQTLVKLSLEFAPGHPIDDALATLKARTATVRAEIRQQSRRGRVPHKLRETLRRDAEWFYETAIEGVPNRTMALRYFRDALRPEDRTKDIRAGVARARKLLEMTPYRFRRGPSGGYKDSPIGEIVRSGDAAVKTGGTLFARSIAPGGNSPGT